MCISPIHIKYDPQAHFIYNRFAPRSVQYYEVPCGKCVECQSMKQNHFMLRFHRVAKQFNSCHFLTLTYRDNTVPVQHTLFECDYDTGELRYLDSYVYSSRFEQYFEDLVYFSRLELLKYPIEKFGRKYWFEYSPVPGIHVCTTLSLCREDVRLWLKSCRVAYEREFGIKLPKFAYTVVGEYGSHTHRPHYHCCFFGLNSRQVYWMAERWKNLYGYYFYEKVNAVNNDGSDGFALMGRYLSKYMEKGHFESVLVKDKLVQKPRKHNSKSFGTDLNDAEKRYFLAFDLYGPYDQNSLRLVNGSELSQIQLDTLVSEVARRSRFKFGEYNYSMPVVMNRKLFGYVSKFKGLDGKNKWLHSWYSLHFLVAQFKKCQFDELRAKQYEFFRQDRPTLSPNALAVEFEEYCKLLGEASNKIREENFVKFYSFNKDRL